MSNDTTLEIAGGAYVESAVRATKNVYIVHGDGCPSARFACSGHHSTRKQLSPSILWWPAMSEHECAPMSTFASRMVEAPGVEPGSEDHQCTASTCVADSLSFAAVHAHRQA